MTELGDAVDALRRQAGFETFKELGDAAGLHHSQVGRIVRGDVQAPRAETLAKIEDATGARPRVLSRVLEGELTAADVLQAGGAAPVTRKHEVSALQTRLTAVEEKVEMILDRLGELGPSGPDAPG